MLNESYVLVDSSSWIEMLRPRGKKEIKDRVIKLLEEGRAAWCDIVAVELWHGARGKSEREILKEFQRTLSSFQIDSEVWNLARTLSIVAASNGVTSPTTDIIIAACAFYHRLDLEHVDKHLTLLEKLRPLISYHPTQTPP